MLSDRLLLLSISEKMASRYVSMAMPVPSVVEDSKMDGYRVFCKNAVL